MTTHIYDFLEKSLIQFSEKIAFVEPFAKERKEITYKDFDIVMMGPQVSYRIKEVRENTGLPCAQIESFDYAIANCPNIMNLAKKLYAEI